MDLYDYHTGDYIREATPAESRASRLAAEADGGAGVILLGSDGRVLRPDDRGADEARRCFVRECSTMKSQSTIRSALASIRAEIAECDRLRSHPGPGLSEDDWLQRIDSLEMAAEALCWVLDHPWPGVERLELGQSCDEPDGTDLGPSEN